jgi:hypothetical protein
MPLTLTLINAMFCLLPLPGWHQPSPFEQISSSQHASVWEGFRNIDPDKEARLLQVSSTTSGSIIRRHTTHKGQACMGESSAEVDHAV